MSTIFALFFFLLTKIFQYLNTYVLSDMLLEYGDYKILIFSFVFLISLMLISVLIERFAPRMISVIIIIAIIALGVSFFTNPILFMSFLIVLFLYGMIGSEAQVFSSLSEHKKIPRIVLLISLITPVVGYNFLAGSSEAQPVIFYAALSLLALIHSYSVKKYKKEELGVKGNHSSPWTGILFMSVAYAMYKASHYIDLLGSDDIIILFALFFYIGGALFTYTSINAKIITEASLKKRREIHSSLKSN